MGAIKLSRGLHDFSDRDSVRMDIACGLYWYCARYHAGQRSRLYAALCRNPYSPGPLEHGPTEGLAADYYTLLCDRGALRPGRSTKSGV